MFVSDNFNRADGALGSNWITGGALNIAPVISGNAFTSGSGASDNKSPSAFNNGGFALWNGTFANNQIASIQLTAIGANGTDCNPGVVVRGNASNMDGYYAFAGRNTTGGNNGYCVELWKNVSGVGTFLGGRTSIPSILVGDTISISVFGNVITDYYNGIPVNSFTDSNLTGGKPGICAELGSPGTDVPAATTKANNFAAYDFSDVLTTLASDNFIRANGSLGSNWTDGVPACAILSNQVHGSTNNNCYDSWATSVLTAPNDQFSQAVAASIPTSQSTNNAIDLLTRVSGTSYYMIRGGGGTTGQNVTFSVYTRVSGTFTLLSTTFTPYAASPATAVQPLLTAGHTYALNSRGNMHWFTDNGTPILLFTDTSLSSGQFGIGGFASDNGPGFWSNWVGGRFGTGGGGGGGGDLGPSYDFRIRI